MVLKLLDVKTAPFSSVTGSGRLRAVATGRKRPKAVSRVDAESLHHRVCSARADWRKVRAGVA